MGLRVPGACPYVVSHTPPPLFRPMPISACSRRRGLTLIELLAVIAVIGVLGTLTFFGVGKLRSKAKRAECTSNLRQIGISLINSANENRGKLPDNTNRGAWAWDVNYSIIQLLGRPSDLKEIAYCPDGHFPEKDILWDGFASGGFRAIGYVLLLPGTPSVNPSELNETLTPKPYLTLDGQPRHPTAAKKELAVDATISLGYLNFTNVPGQAPSPHRANHLNGDRPSGGNIVFLDGHVETRPFAEMTNHVYQFGRAWFWW